MIAIKVQFLRTLAYLLTIVVLGFVAYYMPDILIAMFNKARVAADLISNTVAYHSGIDANVTDAVIVERMSLQRSLIIFLIMSLLFILLLLCSKERRHALWHAVRVLGVIMIAHALLIYAWINHREATRGWYLQNYEWLASMLKLYGYNRWVVPLLDVMQLHKPLVVFELMIVLSLITAFFVVAARSK